MTQRFFAEVNRLAKRFMSDEHFTVAGTLIQAWASQKSFRRKDGSDDGDGSDFHGEKRANDTHQSSTDPDARLYRKSYGKESKLAYLGHRACTEEREGASLPHRPENDRHSGYHRSLGRRWLVEKTFGWMKATGPLRQVKLRGLAKVDWIFVFSCAAHNLLRLPRLLAAPALQSLRSLETKQCPWRGLADEAVQAGYVAWR